MRVVKVRNSFCWERELMRGFRVCSDANVHVVGFISIACGQKGSPGLMQG